MLRAVALSDFDGLLRWDALQEWIATHDLPGSGPVVAVEALTGGSQNHVYRLTRRDGAAFVLRRPPRHLRANSNETMAREARVLAALADTDVPHPRFHAVCVDHDVIGVSFYCMDLIDGFVPQGGLGDRWPDPTDGRRLGWSFVDAIACLAAVEPDARGLGDFGKADGWLERQVGRWRSQLDSYAALDGYAGPDIDGVDRVGDWLDAHRPTSCRIGVLHGDYQFANIMLSRSEPRVAGIIDWELSTLGDPLLDLAWLLTAWHDENDPPGKPGALTWAGMPTRAELVERYADITGRDTTDMPWYFVLACYKLGIILEGTHARASAGHAPKEFGDLLHAMTLWLFAMANRTIDRT
jgi:aminoglycoside phosphotransferase (APT) family kinase protein